MTMNWFKVILITILVALVLYIFYNVFAYAVLLYDSQPANQTIDTNATQTTKKWFGKTFARLHGTTAVIAWLALTPIATLIARYHRSELNLSHLGFGQIWFQIHRFSMYMNLVLNILSAIFIYMRIGGWSGVQFHTVLGVITMSLVTVQTVIATYCRPSLLSRNRKLFNWSHFLMGNTAFLLSVITIYCALDYRIVETRRTRLLWLLNALIAIIAINVCVFEFRKYFKSFRKRRKREEELEQMAMESLNSDSKSTINEMVEHKESKLTANAFKLLVLEIEIIAITVITTAVCVYILDP